MAEKEKMRKENSNRIKLEIFKKKAQNVTTQIGGNLSNHFMNIYLIDLLVIIYENNDIDDMRLVDEMRKKNNTSKIATFQYINSVADSIKQWLNLNANSKNEKDKIKEISKGYNVSTNILKMFVKYIENFEN